MKKILLLLSILFMPFLSFADDSLAEPQAIWNKDKVTVCWQNEDKIAADTFLPSQLELIPTNKMITPTEEIKKLVKKIITEEYKKSITGIYFTGWKNCSESKDWDLAIFTSSNPSASLLGLALIGQGYTPKEIRVGSLPEASNRKSFLYFDTFNSYKGVTTEQNIEITVLHEFGHVAGLRHEHARIEAKADPICRDHTLSEGPYSSTESFGNYDPTSIMSYCFMDLISMQGLVVKDDGTLSALTNGGDQVVRSEGQIKVKIGLSEGDVKTLQCLYFAENKLTDNDCEN